MGIVVFILSLVFGIKTISYGIYEYKSLENKIGGLIVIILAVVSSLLPNILIYLFGI